MEKPLSQKIELPPSPGEKLDQKLQHRSVRLLFCFVGGTLVWLLYFNFVYALTSLTCHWGWFAQPEGGFGAGLKVTQIVATLIAAALIAYIGFVAYREAKEAERGENDPQADTIAARNPMLGFVTMWVNALYLLIILVSLVPILTLPVCMR